MATLVLSTVGTVLGGPVGSAIGALVGQSIDQALFAPKRRGPRIGDLSVQTSSYGTQIPRIYGTMRVAGSVVWATDLVEHAQTGGAKGQPDVAYSYSVSLGVALSSRRARDVKRIWADGKLLRGAARDFKVGTAFRFYDGSEDQVIDPFIGSIEGIANTPAFRGLALAVFEDLELAEFGNRIPFLTFEIEADGEPPALGSVLTDASASIISSNAQPQLIGFAAYGPSIRNAVEPLIECFDTELLDDGVSLRSPSVGPPLIITEDELGSTASAEQAPAIERDQERVPGALRLTYYDPARDYQTGEARALAGEQAANEAQQQLPAVLGADDAKSLTQQMLARAWSRRDKLTLRLPPSRIGIEPGSRVELPRSPSSWLVERITIDGFAVVAELRPSTRSGVAVLADSGRIVPNTDVSEGELSFVLLDVPSSLDSTGGPGVLLAASSTSPGWKRRPVEIRYGGRSVAAETARAKSVLGQANTVLTAGAADLIDEQNSVEITLLDADLWLESCDDEALAAGKNLAVVGSELIQFGGVDPLGEGRFRLRRLLRGRGGTEWACEGHTEHDLFCLIEPSSLRRVELPSWSIGSVVDAAIAGNPQASHQFTAESSRPLSPVNCTAEIQTGGDLLVEWTRRSRQGFAWLDEVDSPLGEAREQYRVSLTGSLGSIEFIVEEPSLALPAESVAALS